MAQIQVSVKKCDLCEQSDGQFYCYECQHALCNNCRDKHDKIPALKAHTSTGIQNVDLSCANRKLHCEMHKNDFVFHCEDCKCLICYKCLRSTHKDHAFIDVDEQVSEERQSVINMISEAKVKIELLSELKEKVKTGHLVTINNKSKETKKEIESAFQELTKVLRSKKEVKIKELEDFQKLESQELESFVQDLEQLLTKYSSLHFEMNNLLSEKHNVTFHLCYSALKIDMQNQDRIPEEPDLKEIPSFDERMFYKEIVDFANSKFKERLCEHCNSTKKEIDMLVTENVQNKETNERYKTENENLKEQVSHLTQKGDTDESRFKAELHILQEEIRNLKETKEIQEKRHGDEMKKTQEEMDFLRKEGERGGRRPRYRYNSQEEEIRYLKEANKAAERRHNEEMQKMKEEICSLKGEDKGEKRELEKITLPWTGLFPAKACESCGEKVSFYNMEHALNCKGKKS